MGRLPTVTLPFLCMDPAPGESLRPSFELFWGRTNPAATTLYVRCPPSGGQRVRITGHVEGPECPQAATLRADFPLSYLGDDPQPLAQATITEPCFWTPRTPYVYRAEVELWRDEQVVARERRLCAPRPLGAVGRNLVLTSKRWVLRGVWREELLLDEIDAWIDAAAVACVPAPSDEVCQQATLRGLGIAARVAKTTADVAQELRRLAQWPAVMIAVLPADTPLAALTSPPPGLVLAQLAGADQPWALRPWAQGLIAGVESPAELGALAAQVACPVIALRRSAAKPVDAARADCDRLQAALASVGDFAGYLV